MTQKRKNISEVEAFLDNIHKLIDNPSMITINDYEWESKINKTRVFMAETGITKTDVLGVVKEMRVCNYSYTDEDVNPNYYGEEVWVFGITKEIIDTQYDLYVKIKIRKIKENEMGIIMSFHPEQPFKENDKLIFPYMDV